MPDDTFVSSQIAVNTLRKLKNIMFFFEKWEEIPLLLCCIEIRRLSCHYGLTEKRTQSTLNIIVKGHHFV